MAHFLYFIDLYRKAGNPAGLCYGKLIDGSRSSAYNILCLMHYAFYAATPAPLATISTFKLKAQLVRAFLVIVASYAAGCSITFGSAPAPAY